MDVVALVMTILTVVAMLGGISLLLWVSTFIESRHLGPAVTNATDTTAPTAELAPALALSVVEAVGTAA